MLKLFQVQLGLKYVMLSIGLVESSVGVEWFGIGMVFEIRHPNHLKTDQNGRILKAPPANPRVYIYGTDNCIIVPRKARPED